MITKQGIYTYNLSVPKRFILDVPNQSPPYLNAFAEILCTHQASTVCTYAPNTEVLTSPLYVLYVLL